MNFKDILDQLGEEEDVNIDEMIKSIIGDEGNLEAIVSATAKSCEEMGITSVEIYNVVCDMIEARARRAGVPAGIYGVIVATMISRMLMDRCADLSESMSEVVRDTFNNIIDMLYSCVRKGTPEDNEGGDNGTEPASN